VPGVDLVFIGTGDLALSLGTFPETGPAHRHAVQQVYAACRAANVPCGLFTFHTTFAIEQRRQGFQMVVIGTDSDILTGYAKAQVGRFAIKPPAASLSGAVALVTGTNRGIGPAIARALLAAGATKVYCATRRPDANAALVAEAPDRLVPVALDITRPEEIRAAAERCGDVGLLVNNAGINFNTPLIGIGADNARAEIETNYLGTLAMCRAFAPILKRNGGGTIVNMVSILAHMNLPLGTFVKVTNLRNGRSAVLRVNDRGPYVDGRVIDVSYNAAKALDFKARGLQRVRIDVVHPELVASLR